MRNAILALLICSVGWGATVSTQVVGTVTLPTGANLNGTIYITWQRFTAVGGEIIPPPARPLEVRIQNGTFTVNLIPTDTATPTGIAYTVFYSFYPGQVEYWNVPTSATPVNASSIATTAKVDTSFIVALTQLSPSGAVTGQCIVWNGYWQPGACATGGGGGSGNVSTSGSLPSGQLVAGAGSQSISPGNLTGDTTTSGGMATITARVNGVVYPTSPATNSSPVVTATNTVTYKALPTGGTNGCAGTSDVVRWNSSTQSWSCGTVTGGGGSGSVTSVGLTMPTGFNVTGSPVTSTGTMAVTTSTTAAVTFPAGVQTGDGTTSGIQCYTGLTSGQVCLSVGNVAGTAITYLWPATNGAAKQVLMDTGTTGCPTLPAGYPTTCHQMTWQDGLLTKICPVGLGATGTVPVALNAGTYILDAQCRNRYPGTYTIAGVECIADGGASTVNVQSNSGANIISSAITAGTSWTAGTLSITSLAPSAWLKFTFTADGTSKQIRCDVWGSL